MTRRAAVCVRVCVCLVESPSLFIKGRVGRFEYHRALPFQSPLYDPSGPVCWTTNLQRAPRPAIAPRPQARLCLNRHGRRL